MALFCLLPLQGVRQLPGVTLNGRVALELLGQGFIRAGAARVRIPLGEHPVLAGYPGLRRASSQEPVYARALALEVEGMRALIGSIDTLLVPGSLEEEVLRRARLPPLTCLLLAATHTHSGPGGTWDNVLAGWSGAGPFDRGQRDAIAQATADALTQAIAALGPAELLVARDDWPAGPARARSEGPIDPQLVALRVRRPSGETVATLIDYPMHPTSEPRRDRRLSGDWPGKVAQALEGPPVLVLQGAGGNATWHRGEDVAGAVAREAEQLLRRAEPGRHFQLWCQARLVALPAPQASPAVPWPLRRALANAIALSHERAAVETRLRIGPLTLVGIPGEPVGELGLKMRPDVLVGLSDGYVGYVETPERWSDGAGEAARTYFGPGLAQALGLGVGPP
ncbi:MAG TPA: neutral/alkaline non-lysosomal ceramidase N-terminal domain-containing protein [Myxococcales bacterium]|nr:neutral/alkaline non-lysosomal ceramidase N-terminal domain-containing protein [Myxococcales bacterium]